MPRIRIMTERRGPAGLAVMRGERVATSDLTSDHFAAALIERIGWALADTDEAEQRRGS
jgi:hypothetical protein